MNQRFSHEARGRPRTYRSADRHGDLCFLHFGHDDEGGTAMQC